MVRLMENWIFKRTDEKGFGECEVRERAKAK
jgi:hypothetical protein